MPLAETMTDANTLHLMNVWGRIKERLKTIYGAATFNSWLQAIEFKQENGSQIELSVPSRFAREWVSNHYLPKIEALWQDEMAGVHRVEITIRKSEAHTTSAQKSIVSGIDVSGQNISALTKKGNIDVLDDNRFTGQLDRRFTFDNFVVDKSNELAYAAAKAVAEAGKTVPGSNPLFLYGGVGLGKTHLMHAIAWHIKENQPERRVVYLSAEKFMYQFIKALREKDVMSFKEQLRSIDVLMIDDVQFISGKESTQEEFFHTFNALIDQDKQLIISGDRSPSDLESVEERIRSRLGWGLVADINQTTYELRLGVLQSKVAQMPKANIPLNVLELMAQKITSNIRELEGSLNKVVAHSILMNRKVTTESVRDILSDLLRVHERSLTVDDIQRTVADFYHIRLSDMTSARRLKSVARPRQVAMYLAKQLTTRSLSEIGKRFGGKDHTTVIHAVKRIESLSKDDLEMAEEIIQLKRSLSS